MLEASNDEKKILVWVNMKIVGVNRRGIKGLKNLAFKIRFDVVHSVCKE